MTYKEFINSLKELIDSWRVDYDCERNDIALGKDLAADDLDELVNRFVRTHPKFFVQYIDDQLKEYNKLK